MKRYVYGSVVALGVCLWGLYSDARDVQQDIDCAWRDHMDTRLQEYWALWPLEERNILLEVLKEKRPYDLLVMIENEKRVRDEMNASIDEQILENKIRACIRAEKACEGSVAYDLFGPTVHEYWTGLSSDEQEQILHLLVTNGPKRYMGELCEKPSQISRFKWVLRECWSQLLDEQKRQLIERIRVSHPQKHRDVISEETSEWWGPMEREVYSYWQQLPYNERERFIELIQRSGQIMQRCSQLISREIGTYSA